ncbi:phospholipase D alpha 1-like [Homarus americanus]|uniref:phospholipase D n=1 Tax=Homarus americanus TaxID=6706 RepID=A0A8J5TK09_HOMAM|nr:phospholipase D alpha 1-like [Homarus americanus]KAG7177059.1 Phospholipase D alpha 1-like 1 [Homarus americanus]
MAMLRGYLYVDLIEAENLPDCDTAFFNIDPKDTSDSFAQIKLGTCVICKTAVINNDLSPKWQESHRIPVCHLSDELQIQVLDKDHFSAGVLGEVSIRPDDLMDGETLEGWYPLSGCDGRINIRMNYVPKEQIDATFEVPDCYFSLREGCKVTLYQDAHCPPLPIFESVPTASGEVFDAPCAWIDLYKALNGAQRFIYVTGWSIYTETVLVRGDCDCEEEGKGETFGELLKRKAEEGVRVLVLVWNEKMSTDITAGFMGTHDEDTRVYFEDSDVEVAVVPRIRSLEGMASFFQDQFSQTCYTHHQKTIIHDCPLADGEDLPRIQAFVGGLDITDGRYDTPQHELFKTLQTLHVGDFYNGLTTTTPEVGPRQPWHDIHSRLEGPIALDVLANFTERWRNQVRDREARLLPLPEDEFILDAPVPCDEEAMWSAQIFRSITSDSALFNFDKISAIPRRKGKYVDDSIHRAYIHQIRRADSFLFIENQYFLGSAYNWDDEQSTKAHHLIPLEITQRIIEKMNAGEYLAVYIIVPMFPEGDPTSGPVQEILHWQHRTMQMMYHAIAQAIEANELDTHPKDYLSFFCLGKGECPEEIPEDLPSPDPDTPAQVLREKARLMIYVHSKMMIVDDDYIIVGSANINQRSMGGTRDSEIAVGAFQPLHTREVSGEARGSVFEFRMALWAEHLGGVVETHMNPGSLECMRAVNEMAEGNWAAYATEEPCKVDGHLLRYPVEVDQDGTVTAIEGLENFPDTEAPVLGATNFLPNKLTT